MRTSTEFLTYYGQTIVPALDKVYGGRKDSRPPFFLHPPVLWIGGVVAALLTLAIVALVKRVVKGSDGWLALALFPLVAGIIAGIWQAIRGTGAYWKQGAQRSKHDAVVPAIRYLAPDLKYDENGEISRALVTQSRILNLPESGWKTYRGCDRFAGHLDGIPVDLCQVEWEGLVADSDSNTTEMKYGLFCVAGLDTRLIGTTVLEMDFAEQALGAYATGLLEKVAGFLAKMANVSSPGLPPVVRMDHQEFEKMFRVYATDAVEAHRIFTASLMERLLQHPRLLADSLQARSKRHNRRREDTAWKIGLSGGHLFLLLRKQFPVFQVGVERNAFDFATYRSYHDDLELLLGLRKLFNDHLKVK